MTEKSKNLKSSILGTLDEALGRIGIDVETACDIEGEGGKLKCVVVTPNLKKSVREMGASPRDQVVMVRVDDETSKDLDAWVATGAVKSRSEAAALFIREGLKVRASELGKLREALDDVESARDRLKRRAQEVFGDELEEEAAPRTDAPAAAEEKQET